MAVKFKSIDKVNRTATFDVDGEEVTRKIPAKFAGSIDDHLRALARGIHVEANEKLAKAIEIPSIKANKVLASNEEI